MTEDELIEKLRAIVAPAAPSALLVGIGDDAAVWQPSRSHRSVITTDALVEGVHFTRAAMSAADAGHRALASNLSDIAAMGAKPVLATIAFGTGAADEAWILECYRGIAALAVRTGCAIAGGDIVRAPAITIAITIVGEVRPSNLKTRAGMHPGDTIAVTGPLGASRAGLAVSAEPQPAGDPDALAALAAFRTPEPRLAEGRWLAASRNVRAMMDTSDGLSTDLARLARASGTGATIETIPVAAAAQAIAQRSGANPEQWALDGGEDFELLVAVATRAFSHLAGRFHARFGRPLLRVGVATAEGGVRFADGRAVTSAGWDHLRAEAP
ncbi:MAG TPA: thiamine-phosphate kinase [Candidatus Lustribacter sp.]|nr:thiamine-phosphate kinase [Candidatus Lustribacter sp.]